MSPLETIIASSDTRELIEPGHVMALGEEALDRARGISDLVQRAMERIAENEALTGSTSTSS